MEPENGRDLVSSAALLLLVTASAWCLWESFRLRKARRSKAVGAKTLNLPSEHSKNNGSTCCSMPADHNQSICCKNSGNIVSSSCCQSNNNPLRGKIFYASQTGTARAFAQKLAKFLQEKQINVEVIDPQKYEPEDISKEELVIIVASTWESGKAPANAAYFSQWLEESSKDFRVGAGLLSTCKFAVFGIGSSAYGETYNSVARTMFRQLTALGGVRIIPLGEGDQDQGNVEESFGDWTSQLIEALVYKQETIRSKGEALVYNQETIRSKDADVQEEISDHYISGDDSEGPEENTVEEASMMDLEDIAGRAPSVSSVSRKKNIVPKKKFGNVKRPEEEQTVSQNGPKDMVTPVVRANLEKQGYKIIGSHSGVKICRWTKSQLRGRGGCYKHAFYGIESHRCMETTPSLACANKCVFCWRHHTNPVGKSWRWKMDDPLQIVDGAIDQHTRMIKQMKGVPGVTEGKLLEGLSPKHCALSLVGEPIMYPEISQLVEELHRRRISTFLVTNAQFPEAIKSLRPVTQLYVSVDAATKERLKAIDRPLFSDFWERFIDSLKSLHSKQQRTVYRLTLVKGWNTEELDGYLELLDLGKPDFVEIKGVTYCGSSATSTLTMENVPWHEDVKLFSEILASKSKGKYEVACEHAHSCCVLLARSEKFKIQGQWHTWIDYEKFHDLVASGKDFSSKDYIAPTPFWAVYGAKEGGFDPGQERFKKERRHGSRINGENCQ
eukprot:TRINITY_DN3859_c0_g1_i1.p1 TRINITY_DN3859_c0_g1~~TRINITY_DN3859_c0_g1_i1.p1  ORF type:complete len:726 (-),score=97.12 TRINITY_DN3859_c0_g1_i1:406-2583(-)